MNVDWSCDRNKTRESAVNVILDRVHALFFPCNLVFLAVNVHRKRSVVKDFLDQCTIFPCFVTHSAVQISPQWRTIYLLLLLIQSSLLSSVHVWKRPQLRVLCHAKVPSARHNIARHNIARIDLNFVCRYSRYQNKHVHSQNVDWNSLASKTTQRKFRTVKGGFERNKR